MMTPRLACLLIGFCLRAGVVAAQPASSDPVSPVRYRQWVVKLAPLGLVDPDNTVQFGIERMVGRRQAVQVEVGYGWAGLNLWRNTQNESYSDREVWRGRAEWRYYFGTTQQPLGPYVAIEGFYKQVNVRESGTSAMGCEDGPCQYYRLYNTPVQKYVWGGHAKIGRQLALTDDERLRLDIYAGLGFRRRVVDRSRRPEGSYYYVTDYAPFNSFQPLTYATVSLTYGLKVGWAF